MPNPWDVGSARLLEASGFQALATTSAGFAWSIGKLDQSVTRDELVAHVASLAAATSVPLNVDSERCYPDDPGGVAETVALLAGAGAAGLSIEDYDPAAGAMDDVGLAAERVAAVAEAAHRLADPMVVTGRAENHIRGVDDLDDTIARLIAYRDAGRGRGVCAGPVRARPDRQGRRGRRDPGERPRPARRASDRRTGLRRRAPRLDRQPPGRSRLCGADRRSAGAQHRRHLTVRGECRPEGRARRRIRLEPQPERPTQNGFTQPSASRTEAERACTCSAAFRSPAAASASARSRSRQAAS